MLGFLSSLLKVVICLLGCRVCDVYPEGNQRCDEPVVGQFASFTDAAPGSVEDQYECQHKGLH